MEGTFSRADAAGANPSGPLGCHGWKIKIRLAVLTADYPASGNKPNPSARRGKQACLALVCSYHAIGNVVFESCGERISMKTSAMGSYRQLA